MSSCWSNQESFVHALSAPYGLMAFQIFSSFLKTFLLHCISVMQNNVLQGLMDMIHSGKLVPVIFIEYHNLSISTGLAIVSQE